MWHPWGWGSELKELLKKSKSEETVSPAEKGKELIKELLKRGDLGEAVSLASKDNRIVHELLRLLDEDDGILRSNAVWVLGKIAEEDAAAVKSAVPRLLKLLRDSHTWVRRDAAYALGNIGDSAMLPALQSLTADSTETVVLREGKRIKTTVGEVAQKAIERIEASQGKKRVEEKVPATLPQREVSPSQIVGQSLQDYGTLIDTSPYAIGGFADIFRATEKSSGEIVAVKLPRVPRESGIVLTLNLKTINEFREEADKWSRLRHPHILAVRAYGDKPLPWIAMEFAAEGSLRKRLMAGKLPLRGARDIAIKLCSALQYAHFRGVAHLDIKPENVLFVKGEPNLSDWGTARTLLYESVTRSKFTPEYAAPEQLDPRYGEPDWQTDVYQLGVMLYEMASGRLPFLSQIPALLLQEILEKTPEKVSRVNPEATPALDEILLRALAKKKGERYEAVLELRKELERLELV